jgi:hypothetical protein
VLPGGSGIDSSPALINGLLVIGANDGRVYGFGKKPLAPSKKK